jgi:hypothetical protein
LWNIVASQSQLGNLSDFLEIAVLAHPEQLQMRDVQSGSFVLHLAASFPPIPASVSYSRRQQGVAHQSRDVIDIIVEGYPAAARFRNHNGDFPLHLALT